MPITAKVREAVLMSGDCAYCGDVPTQVDHIMPRSRGGGDDRDNLAPACRRCNMEKLDFTPDEWREWRLEEGYGWPPERLIDVITRLVAEAKRRYPLLAPGDDRADGEPERHVDDIRGSERGRGLAEQ